MVFLKKRGADSWKEIRNDLSLVNQLLFFTYKGVRIIIIRMNEKHAIFRGESFNYLFSSHIFFFIIAGELKAFLWKIKINKDDKVLLNEKIGDFF